MIKWTKLPILDYFSYDSNLTYIIPCEEGSQIWFEGERCIVEDVTVQEIIDKFNTIGCTSFQLTKEEIETMIEELKEENNNEKM